mmetsp:Transcript_10651/g.29167  ORF Transcript_10651/g.29167 Transcript_10651/m.29167 type:complete len:450 (-) Transcript_10651:747-2096(-)
MRGELVFAIRLYGEAIKLAPNNGILYSNRALAKLKAMDASGCLQDSMVAATLDPTNHKALHRCATAKRQLGMLESATGDLKRAIALAKQPKERLQLQEDLKQVTADLEAQKRAFQKAKQEKEAKRAATNKSFKYKGGLTIEEHSDEEDSKDGASAVADKLQQFEMTAARVVARVQQQAPSARDAFEVQRKEALAEHAKQLHQLQQERARQQEQQQQQAHKQELARKQVKEQQQQSAVSPAAAAPPSTPAAANATASASGATQPPPATPAAVASPANSSTAAGAADPFAGMGLEEVKKKGADMFQAREWEGAKAAWEYVLQHAQPQGPLAIAVHSNLALLHVQSGAAEQALAHATAVMEATSPRDNTFHKALHRRALALTKLGKLEEAMADYRELNKLRGYSVQVENEMNALSERMCQSVPSASPAEPSTSPQQQQQQQQGQERSRKQYL